jgi:hypothetical protein
MQPRLDYIFLVGVRYKTIKTLKTSCYTGGTGIGGADPGEGGDGTDQVPYITDRRRCGRSGAARVLEIGPRRFRPIKFRF